MSQTHRIYLVAAKLVEKPTWGGNYIAKLKGIATEKKIGQSYELFDKSKLIDKETIIQLNHLMENDLEGILGKRVFKKYGTMPLLIKINQARGNSFQLHIKPEVIHPKWQAKPESWYFLKDGKITYGIREGISVDEYKKVCKEIERLTKGLSNKVINGEMLINEAREMAGEVVKKLNPWQFVQTKKAGEGEIWDISTGGLHHSWEDDPESEWGNLVYEVQINKRDEVSTIRAFDQGKMLDDGTIREVQIDDYFQFLETNREVNSRERMAAITTTDYAMEVIDCQKEEEDRAEDTFRHLFVKEGVVKIESEENEVIVGQGQSCFVPAAVKKIKIKPITKKTVLLKTYVND